MTEKEIEEKANEIRKNEKDRLQFCKDVGITEDEFFVNRNGDFEIEDMIRAFENGKMQGKILNEYFITVSVAHYQHLPETIGLFINTVSGKSAFEKVREQIKKRFEGDKGYANEVTGIELLDIRRL